MDPHPARAVIKKFGGQSALAALIGRRQSTIGYWAKKGIIPAKWQPKLLELAKANGIDLSPQDFVELPKAEVPLSPKRPFAIHMGSVSLGDAELTCFVLNDGRRIISRSAVVRALTEGKAKDFNEAIPTGVMNKYLPPDLRDRLVEFDIEGVPHAAKGLTAETFIETCNSFSRAFRDGADLSDRQRLMAIRCIMFLSACATVGLISLIDEATGYQYERPTDALQVRLKAFLEDAMRKWEKTFPDQLWAEFGRLTNWKGAAAQRPKYWGKLVMELIYDYLDKDVANWLRDNAPTPQKGQNYHQWLTSQFGLRKLTEHIWMLIGMASTCFSIRELRTKLAERFGRIPVQFTLFVEPPSAPPVAPPPNFPLDDLS